MYVVSHAADHKGGAFPMFEDSGLVREQSVAMFLWDQRLTTFRAIDEMHQIFDERLRHDVRIRDCAALSGLVICSFY